jgi:hypothetical protein
VQPARANEGVLFWNSLICLKPRETLVGVFGSFDHYSPKTS